MKAALSLPRRPSALLMIGVLDIVVLLLVFFILVTEASQEAGVMVSPAESQWRLSRYEATVSVTVKAGVDPAVYIGRERVDRSSFRDRLEDIVEKSGADTVLLRVDAGASVAVQSGIMEDALALGLRVALVGSDPAAESPLAPTGEAAD